MLCDFLGGHQGQYGQQGDRKQIARPKRIIRPCRDELHAEKKGYRPEKNGEMENHDGKWIYQATQSEYQEVRFQSRGSMNTVRTRGNFPVFFLTATVEENVSAERKKSRGARMLPGYCKDRLHRLNFVILEREIVRTKYKLIDKSPKNAEVCRLSPVPSLSFG